jgi:hypothetical protein
MIAGVELSTHTSSNSFFEGTRMVDDKPASHRAGIQDLQGFLQDRCFLTTPYQWHGQRPLPVTGKVSS